MSRWIYLLLFVSSVCRAELGPSALLAETELPDYRPAGGVSGTIRSVGSDTLNNLMTFWAERFIRYYPNVHVEIEGKGSSTAPPALIEGASNFGPMSREMTRQEIAAFEHRFGYPPVAARAAIDMLTIYVHRDNPIRHGGLDLSELDAIFSQTRRRGHPEDIVTWGQLGLGGDWEHAPISLYGRNSASGTYGFFKSRALLDGDYKSSVKEMPGSSALVYGVANDRYGIGYSGFGYNTADVAAVALSEGDGPPVPPRSERVSDYPLARFLLVYLNRDPRTTLDPLRREFLEFVLSRQGQELVLKDGYLPVSRVVAERSLARIRIGPASE